MFIRIRIFYAPLSVRLSVVFRSKKLIQRIHILHTVGTGGAISKAAESIPTAASTAGDQVRG